MPESTYVTLYDTDGNEKLHFKLTPKEVKKNGKTRNRSKARRRQKTLGRLQTLGQRCLRYLGLRDAKLPRFTDPVEDKAHY